MSKISEHEMEIGISGERNIVQVSEELRNRLKHRGVFDDRIAALEKFNETVLKDMVHGLNIKTEVESLELFAQVGFESTVLSEGAYEFKHSHQDLLDDRIQVFNLHEFLGSKDATQLHSERKEKVMQIISMRNDASGSDIHENKPNKLNKLDYLHRALSNIKIILFRDNFHMKETFRIENVVSGNRYNQLIIFVGKNSDVNILVNTTHPEGYIPAPHGSLITDFTNIVLNDYARCDFLENRNMNNKDIIYGRKSAELGTGAEINWINIDKNSRSTMMEQHAKLFGENSKSVTSNILCGKNSEYTIYNISEHTGRNTESLIQDRCVLKSSKAIIKGLIRINEEAFNSNGYQKSDILMLDEESRAISMPDLEIHNNQVKCTHGSTITRIDDERIFYMQSRGLDKNEASKMLIEGFYDKILCTIRDRDVADELKRSIVDEQSYESNDATAENE